MKLNGKQQASTAASPAEQIQSENKQQEIAIGPTISATTTTTSTKKPAAATKKPPPPPAGTRNSVLPPSDDKRPGDTPTIYAEIQDPGKQVGISEQ